MLDAYYSIHRTFTLSSLNTYSHNSVTILYLDCKAQKVDFVARFVGNNDQSFKVLFFWVAASNLDFWNFNPNLEIGWLNFIAFSFPLAIRTSSLSLSRSLSLSFIMPRRHLFAHTHTHAYLHVPRLTHTLLHLHTHVHTRTHTHTDTYTLTSAHTRTHFWRLTFSISLSNGMFQLPSINSTRLAPFF